MKIYKLTITDNAAEFRSKDLNGQNVFRESKTIIRATEDEIIEYALHNVEKYFNSFDFPGRTDENGDTIDDFIAQLNNKEDICIQGPESHICFEFSSDDILADQPQVLAEALLESLKKDKSKWKKRWLKKVCELCLEYLTLDGLSDAKRAADIPDDILDIIDKEAE